MHSTPPEASRTLGFIAPFRLSDMPGTQQKHHSICFLSCLGLLLSGLTSHSSGSICSTPQSWKSSPGEALAQPVVSVLDAAITTGYASLRIYFRRPRCILVILPKDFSAVTMCDLHLCMYVHVDMLIHRPDARCLSSNSTDWWEQELFVSLLLMAPR